MKAPRDPLAGATATQRHPGRFVEKDGSLNMGRNAGHSPILQDVYLELLRMPWGVWIGTMLGIYLALNATFATLYWLGGDCIAGARPDSFVDLFFFSVETMSTIGYGEMAPRTTYAHTLVSLEAFTGILCTAVLTGLAFAKFSRATARVSFSRYAVLTTRHGAPYLQFRVANVRSSTVVEPRVRVTFMRDAQSPEGEWYRQFVDVPLERSWTPLFALTWTVLHRIDEDSPFHGQTRESLEAVRAEVLVTFAGIDETMNDTIHARCSYVPAEILEDHRLVDVIVTRPDGSRFVDLGRFHDVEPRDPGSSGGSSSDRSG